VNERGCAAQFNLIRAAKPHTTNIIT